MRDPSRTPAISLWGVIVIYRSHPRRVVPAIHCFKGIPSPSFVHTLNAILLSFFSTVAFCSAAHSHIAIGLAESRASSISTNILRSSEAFGFIAVMQCFMLHVCGVHFTAGTDLYLALFGFGRSCVQYGIAL